MRKKSHLNIIFLVFLFTTMNIFTNAQEETTKTYIPQVIPPSPESQVFERYLNHEIDESSGTPSINIPLYDIKIKGLTIPIHLSYDASGVKHGQFDGTLGVGWSIQSMGYRVFREIHGRPDEKYPFFDKDRFATTLNKCNDPFYGYYFLSLAPNAEFKNIIPSGRYKPEDGEFDLFSYILPSSNGNFIITDRNTMSTAIIEKNGDQINLNKIDGPFPYTRHLKSMQITDKNGYIFELGGTNSSEEMLCDVAKLSDGDEAYNGWALKKIISPYGENIEFEYDVKPVSNSKPENGTLIGIQVMDPARGFIGFPNTGARYAVEDILTESGHIGFILKRIKTEQETIDFLYNETEVAGLPRLPSLNSIIIKDKNGKEIKRIGFNYNSLTGNKWHRMLESIEEGKGQEKIRQYNFDYYLPNESIDDILNVSPDQWGYYSQSHAPGRYYRPLAIHKEFQDYFFIEEIRNPTPYKKLLKTIPELKDCFLDRSKNYGLLHSFSLKRITFPTSGYTEYEYESHQYTASHGVVTGGGQRIKRIISKSDNSSTSIVTEFKYGEKETGIGIANFPSLNKSHFVQESYRLNIGPGSTYAESRNYMMSPIMPEFSKFAVFYKEISTYKVDINNSKSTKIISKYNIPEQYQYRELDRLIRATSYAEEHMIQYLVQGDDSEVSNYSLGLKPNLKERIFYNDKLIPVRKEEYEYESNYMETYEGVKVRQGIYLNLYHSDETYSHGRLGSVNVNNAFEYTNQLCNYTPYYIKIGVNNLLISKKTTDYLNGKSLVKEEKFTYDEFLQLKSRSQSNSQAIEQKEEYKYPYNIGTGIYKTMSDRNIITPVIERTITYNGKQTFSEKTHYTNMGKLILPSRIETSSQNTTNYRDEIIFTRYDKRGNILEYMTPDGVYTSIIWGYNYQYPIAKIQNMRYQDIEDYYQAEYLDMLASETIPEDYLTDDLYIFLGDLPATVHAATYTYEPLIGVTSIEEPSGIKTYYEYDPFGRLIRIEDGKGKAIKEYDYQYSNK